ncbi:MAG: hypothetical protein M3P24_03600 [Gemmatimonadota bacterium]|nr:hypothetical protein [Gemmatimonadota bacterium]
MSEAARGLVIAHSSLAAGLVAAARQITGAEEEALRALSNDGKGPAALLEALTRELGDAPAVLFTDLPSGSCAFGARKVSADRPGTGLVTGVNLTMLIDFVFHRDMPLPQLVERLVEKGRAGVAGVYKEGPAHADRALSG